MSVPEAAVEAAARAEFAHEFHGTPAAWEMMGDDTRNRYLARTSAALEAALPILLAPILALHPKTCDMSGANCKEDECPMLVCGPCGETWPCPTVKVLTE